MKSNFDCALLLLSATLFTTPAAANGFWQQSVVPEQRLSELSPAAVEAVAVALRGGPAAVGEAWSLPLASGTRSWTTTSLEGAVEGDFSWRGVAAGDADSQAIVVRRGRALSGLISTAEAMYELVPAADGNYLVKLDSQRFPQCGGGVAVEAGWSMQPSAAASADNRGGPVSIDVMVVYTPEARDAAGGTSQIEAVAQAAVDASNLSFENALSTPRFRLVATRLANYNDSGSGSTDLSWVRNDAQIAAWRDEVGADMVGLIANSIGGCGIASVMRNPGPGFAGSAFQVTARGCAVGNLSYAHEHGHNMGMEHNPENSSATTGSASYPYSFGHYVSGSYRTVMSYSAPCTGGCTRRPYFSNPNVIFNGVPTGIADERHNAATANNVAAIVAGFRPEAGLLFNNGFE